MTIDKQIGNTNNNMYSNNNNINNNNLLQQKNNKIKNNSQFDNFNQINNLNTNSDKKINNMNNKIEPMNNNNNQFNPMQKIGDYNCTDNQNFNNVTINKTTNQQFKLNNNDITNNQNQKNFIAKNCNNYENNFENQEENSEDQFVKDCIYNRKYNELSDKDLLSNIMIVSKEQAGCRFLQQKIEDDPNFANYELYPEIYDSINELIMDPFGNYLIQKILESLSNDKLLQVNKLVKIN